MVAKIGTRLVVFNLFILALGHHWFPHLAPFKSEKRFYSPNISQVRAQRNCNGFKFERDGFGPVSREEGYAMTQTRFLFVLMERVALNVQPKDVTVQLEATRAF